MMVVEQPAVILCVTECFLNFGKIHFAPHPFRLSAFAPLREDVFSITKTKHFHAKPPRRKVFKGKAHPGL
jgi:hypothetical protein